MEAAPLVRLAPRTVFEPPARCNDDVAHRTASKRVRLPASRYSYLGDSVDLTPYASARKATSIAATLGRDAKELEADLEASHLIC